jgi:hypothetical protein
MPNGEISLAGAALAVALTALAIAIGQLLQQVFSTAEGYRRCQHSAGALGSQDTPYLAMEPVQIRGQVHDP